MGDVAMAANDLRRYLRELRESVGLSQPELASAVGWSVRALSEYETGGATDIKATRLGQVLRVLKGSAEEALRLACAGEEQELDKQHRRVIRARVLALAAELDDDRLHELLSLINELRSDPVLLGYLVGYANRLLEERAAHPANNGSAPRERPSPNESRR
jgi:transcriptional regulator with XRE-family HTH domain